MSVQNAVADNTIVVFSKSWCPYCKRAKELLAKDYHDVQTAIFESVSMSSSLSLRVHMLTSLCRLDQRDDGGEIQAYLLEKTGQRTVPNVFIRSYRTVYPSLVLLLRPAVTVIEQNHIGGELIKFHAPVVGA